MLVAIRYGHFLLTYALYAANLVGKHATNTSVWSYWRQIHLVARMCMKPIPFVLAMFATLLTSCQKNADTVAPATTATFPDIIPGNWLLSVTGQATDDKLKSLNGTSINFVNDGNGTASQSGKSTAGMWVWGGASYYGNPGLNTKTVTFNFGVKAPYDRLSKSWTITSASKSAIELDSANPAEGEHLTFTKQ